MVHTRIRFWTLGGTQTSRVSTRPKEDELPKGGLEPELDFVFDFNIEIIQSSTEISSLYSIYIVRIFRTEEIMIKMPLVLFILPSNHTLLSDKMAKQWCQVSFVGFTVRRAPSGRPIKILTAVTNGFSLF